MITRDDWLKAMEEAGAASVHSDPDAITSLEFSVMFNIDRQAATRRLRRLEEAGCAIRTTKAMPNAAGRMVYWNAWKLIDQKKKR